MATLCDMMEFDHVIRVHRDGAITDAEGVYAPDLEQYENPDGTWTEEDLEDDWELLDGFSGQCGYSGPMMHSSEYIGGRMERHIREHPGLYVAIYPAVISDDIADFEAVAEADEWAVAFREDTDPDDLADTLPDPGLDVGELLAAHGIRARDLTFTGEA